jgi:hypothetical protein
LLVLYWSEGNPRKSANWWLAKVEQLMSIGVVDESILYLLPKVQVGPDVQWLSGRASVFKSDAPSNTGGLQNSSAPG